MISLVTGAHNATRIRHFPFFKIQGKGLKESENRIRVLDLSTRLWEINTEFVGFIPQSLVLRSIV